LRGIPAVAYALPGGGHIACVLERELYEFMVDQFNEARVFVPEVATTILGLLDVLLLLRGT
jgi:hypothetical protein